MGVEVATESVNMFAGVFEGLIPVLPHAVVVIVIIIVVFVFCYLIIKLMQQNFDKSLSTMQELYDKSGENLINTFNLVKDTNQVLADQLEDIRMSMRETAQQTENSPRTKKSKK